MSSSIIQHEYERIRFTICYENISPLSIGTGTTTIQAIPDKKAGAKGKVQMEVPDICLAANGAPYIPSTSMRGLLRQLSCNSPALLVLFGQSKPESEATEDSEKAPKTTLDGDHSRIRIYDAICSDSEARSGLSRHVVIDPITKTAEDGLLFQRQFVIPGTRFEQIIEADRLSRFEAELFTSFIQSLSDIRIGSGANRMQGELIVTSIKTASISISDLGKWLADPTADTLVFSQNTDLQPAPEKSEHLSMTLNCYDALFIYDEMGKDSSGKTTNEMIALRDHNGKHIIPASTLLGGFRSHTRSIILSLLRHKNPNRPMADVIATSNSVTESIFGSVTRSSWLAISTAEESGSISDDLQADIRTQYFNAIDRFTGAVKKGALFYLKAPVNHAFTFRIKINKKLTDIPALSAILLLSLKDWNNGGIRYGWGTNKGFGLTRLAKHCIEQPYLINQLKLEGLSDQSLQTILDDYLTAQLANDPEVTNDEQ